MNWSKFDDETLDKVQRFVEGQIGYNTLEAQGYKLDWISRKDNRDKYLLPVVPKATMLKFALKSRSTKI